jgi:hypothetical protein
MTRIGAVDWLSWLLGFAWVDPIPFITSGAIMPILDTRLLRATLSFDVSDEELERFEPESDELSALAGLFCNNVGCK